MANHVFTPARKITTRIMQAIGILLVLMLLLFLPAGRLDWWMGWVFIAVALGAVIIGVSYLERVNSDSVDSLMELWHEECEFSMPLRPTMRDKDEIRKFYESLPAIYPEHRDDPVDVIIGENKAVIKIVVKNKTADGKIIEFNAFSWMTFQNGKITSIEAIFDSARLMKDLKG